MSVEFPGHRGTLYAAAFYLPYPLYFLEANGRSFLTGGSSPVGKQAI